MEEVRGGIALGDARFGEAMAEVARGEVLLWNILKGDIDAYLLLLVEQATVSERKADC